MEGHSFFFLFLSLFLKLFLVSFFSFLFFPFQWGALTAGSKPWGMCCGGAYPWYVSWLAVSVRKEEMRRASRTPSSSPLALAPAPLPASGCAD